jgi:hypothetical protein
MCLRNMCKQANINARSILGPSIVVNYHCTNVLDLSQVDNNIYVIDKCNQDKIESSLIIWKKYMLYWMVQKW